MLQNKNSVMELSFLKEREFFSNLRQKYVEIHNFFK